MEAFTLGVVVAFYKNVIVLQALYVFYLCFDYPPLFIYINSQVNYAWCLYWSEPIHFAIQSLSLP